MKITNVDEISVNMVGEDFFDLIINDKLQVHIKHSEGNLSFDFYKNSKKPKEEDFIEGVWFSKDDYK